MAARTSTVDASYNARHLLVLEGLEAVRKRPGMYIGSTDTRGLMQCVWEIIDNGVDEALAGHCRRIAVILHADGSIEVGDDGRGIPVDIEPKTGLTGVEVVYTKLHAGGKFGGGSYVATGGLHGVGASVVNALSARLDVEVDRNSATFAMSFQRGVAGTFAAPDPASAFTPGSSLSKPGRVKKGVTGTRVRFWPDRQIFTPDATVAYDELITRARQTSFIVPGLEIVVRDERGSEVAEDTFLHDGGISEFCTYLANDPPVTEVLRLRGVDRFTETVPLLDDAGHMTPQDVERELAVDVALRWGSGYESEVRSFVNVIATTKGGTHVTGFERALTRTFNEVLRQGRLLRTGEADVVKDDVLEGLTAVVTVRLAEPQFEGQTKEILGTPAATKIVARIVGAELKGCPHLHEARRQGAGPGCPGQDRERRADPDRRAAAARHPTPEERPGVERPAGKARGLPQQRRRPQRAVHRRGGFGTRDRQVGARFGVPGAASHSWKDPQYPEEIIG